MTPFAARFADLARSRSPLCLGVDPSPELLGLWGLPDSPDGIRRFCGTVLEAAGELVAMIKPQIAYFERHGAAGLAEASTVATQIRERHSLCTIDAKRGDIESTMEGYAEAIFGASGGLRADAVTLNPYLGYETLQPVIRHAQDTGGGVFVVVRSTTTGGQVAQNARLDDGRTVAEGMADEITTQNAAIGGLPGPVGAVLGATLPACDADIVQRLPRSLILVPGLGAQGARMSDTAKKFASASGRVVPTLSRGILRHGPNVARLRDSILRQKEAAWSVWSETAYEG